MTSRENLRNKTALIHGAPQSLQVHFLPQIETTVLSAFIASAMKRPMKGFIDGCKLSRLPTPMMANQCFGNPEVASSAGMLPTDNIERTGSCQNTLRMAAGNNVALCKIPDTQRSNRRFRLWYLLRGQP